MKTYCTTIIVVLLSVMLVHTGRSQNITTPRTASPAASISQTIGISTVTVTYSRPSVKGREVWGKLVPYGWEDKSAGKDSPWRAGANENTVIAFSHPVKVQGTEVPAGSYGLFFVINKDNTGEVILSKDYQSWGNFFYDPARDQLRAKISVRDIGHEETLRYDFLNPSKNGAELVLNWEKKQFPVTLEFDVDKIVIAHAEDQLKGVMGFTWQGYTSAANYALQNNVALDKASAWIDRAVTQNKNFTTLSTKANLLEATGKTAESQKLMTEALALGTEVEINQYGYQLLGANKFDKAIEILTLNTQRYPKSANAWDSLGEAYALKGDKKNAITNFKKSLGMNPPDNVKANSEKYLKQFGAM